MEAKGWPDGRRWGPPWRQDRRTGRFVAPEPGAFRRRGQPGLGAVLFAGVFQVVGANNLAEAGGVLRAMTPPAYALLLVGPVALRWRRRFPVTVFAVAAAASIGFATFAEPHWTYAVAPGIALFALAKQGRFGAAVIGAPTAYAAYLLVCWIFAGQLGVPVGARPDLRAGLLLAVALAGLIFLGSAAKARSEHMAEMMKVRAERARAQEEQERRQASEERLRIARELHDVLGHHLSLINVQAGVGLHLMDNRPEQAREALSAIKTASSEALREVRAVLGVLRTEDEAAPRQPALGLSRLDDLTADAGLPITTKATGTERELPPEVDRAAYRIVQEALTNVRKHAGPAASASITVDYLPTALHLSIRDEGSAIRNKGSVIRDEGSVIRTDGQAVDPADAIRDGGSAVDGNPGTGAGDGVTESVGGGSGIAGMRARAESLGGTLEAGPVDGGYLVSVLLPAATEEDG